MADSTASHSFAGVRVGGTAPVRIMAVLNVSPESFYRASIRADASEIRDSALRYVDEGADFIDVGAMSTAPYLQTEIGEADECRRMVSAVATVAGAVDVPISADTSRAGVARAALEAGASIINDVDGLRGVGMPEVAAEASGVILMASPGAETLRRAESPIALVADDLRDALGRAAGAGVTVDQVVLDPGIGFYRAAPWPPLDFNLGVLRRLSDLEMFGRPLLVGISRKSFIGEIIERNDPGARLAGSLAATAIAVQNGAAIIRTHDVAATLDAVRVARALTG